MDLFTATIVSAGFGALGVIMARRRHRNGLLWGVLGAVFPLVLLILLILPRVDSAGGA
jgi:hypothetical protein